MKLLLLFILSLLITGCYKNEILAPEDGYRIVDPIFPFVIPLTIPVAKGVGSYTYYTSEETNIRTIYKDMTTYIYSIVIPYSINPIEVTLTASPGTDSSNIKYIFQGFEKCAANTKIITNSDISYSIKVIVSPWEKEPVIPVPVFVTN